MSWKACLLFQQIPRSPAFLVLMLGILILSSCQKPIPQELMEPSDAMVALEGSEVPLIQDDMDWDSLKHAIEQSLVYLGKLPPEKRFQYGPRLVGVQELRVTLQRVIQIIQEVKDPHELGLRLRADFSWFQATGSLSSPRRVLLTGYYLPSLEGRRSPGHGFIYPVYSLPPDLVEVDLGLFKQELKGQRLVGRLQGSRLVPYFTRAQIDRESSLAGKGLEILWLRNQVDLFFLHIQGSGEVFLEDGSRVLLNYAGTNGHPYRSIGRVLIEKGMISQEQVSMQAIREYLEAHPDQAQELLFSNPSYVFFRATSEGPLGYLGVPLTPGRSIATDSKLFPPAALAVVCSSLPQPGAWGRTGPRKPFCRIVLTQDTGGAIRGPARADLYCGSGPQAEFLAGHLQDSGTLYFLLSPSNDP
ncbi:MAG: MltA domain-containing protein [bacterium]